MSKKQNKRLRRQKELKAQYRDGIVTFNKVSDEVREYLTDLGFVITRDDKNIELNPINWDLRLEFKGRK